MKLLILTQKVDINDDLLGFFHSWIIEFAKHCEKLTVICLYEGEHDLPDNVKVLSLGKEKNVSKLKYIINFYKYIWRYRKDYDNVFVHMNVEYVIMGAIFWRIQNKKIGLWHAHGGVSSKLKIAIRMVDTVFSSTAKGCRVKSKKIKIVGQGIDVEKFSQLKSRKNNCFTILTVGRISLIKDYETLIMATKILKERKIDFLVKIIGGIGTDEQQPYLEKLKKLISDYDLNSRFEFLGAIPNVDIQNYYSQADLFINTSLTGSLDKTMLESIASRLFLLTCNETIIEVAPKFSDRIFFQAKDSAALATKIEDIINMDEIFKKQITDYLYDEIKKGHSIDKLIKRILMHYK